MVDRPRASGRHGRSGPAGLDADPGLDLGGSGPGNRQCVRTGHPLGDTCHRVGVHRRSAGAHDLPEDALPRSRVTASCGVQRRPGRPRADGLGLGPEHGGTDVRGLSTVGDDARLGDGSPRERGPHRVAGTAESGVASSRPSARARHRHCVGAAGAEPGAVCHRGQSPEQRRHGVRRPGRHGRVARGTRLGVDSTRAIHRRAIGGRVLPRRAGALARHFTARVVHHRTRHPTGVSRLSADQLHLAVGDRRLS